MAGGTLRRITEEDLVRIMQVDEVGEDLEIMAHRFCSKPYVLQDDIAQLTAAAMEIRMLSMIMKRFLNGHMDVQVAVEKGKGFTAAKAD